MRFIDRDRGSFRLSPTLQVRVINVASSPFRTGPKITFDSRQRKSIKRVRIKSAFVSTWMSC